MYKHNSKSYTINPVDFSRRNLDTEKKKKAERQREYLYHKKLLPHKC